MLLDVESIEVLLALATGIVVVSALLVQFNHRQTDPSSIVIPQPISIDRTRSRTNPSSLCLFSQRRTASGYSLSFPFGSLGDAFEGFDDFDQDVSSDTNPSCHGYFTSGFVFVSSSEHAVLRHLDRQLHRRIPE